METWIATGDETGKWDIENGHFSPGNLGVAWALGTAQAWDRALQMRIGEKTALEVFSEPMATRLPAVLTSGGSAKYHVKDVWECVSNEQARDVQLDTVQDHLALEQLRSDAQWLLCQSGLGVLAVGGSREDAKASGLGASGDGMRERARAFAGLMTVALPFFPGDTRLNLLIEGRTESALANLPWSDAPEFGEYGSRNTEPFRIFLAQLHEDLKKSAGRCQSLVASGSTVNNFYAGGKKHMKRFIDGNQLHNAPFLKAHAEQAVAAMNGISDLAAALVPRPQGPKCRLVVPPGFSDNIWAGNFKELRHAIRS